VKTSNETLHEVFRGGVRIEIRRIFRINQDLLRPSINHNTDRLYYGKSYRTIHVVGRVIEGEGHDVLTRKGIST
jgi:hypothetical protein